jgi:Protein of unknown function (DUF1475)
MVTFLKILFASLCLYMAYVVISTSADSNLFNEWSKLAQIPWMTATIKDFYANTVVIFVWIAYKEQTMASRLVWLLLIVGLGSIAVTLYVLIQLFKLQPGDTPERVLLRARG